MPHAHRSRHRVLRQPERHEYELYLAIENIDHTRTKTKHPQTNGICERFHKTVLNEFYRVAFRKKLYRSLEELQADLDVWLAAVQRAADAPRPVVLWEDADADLPRQPADGEGEDAGSVSQSGQRHEPDTGTARPSVRSGNDFHTSGATPHRTNVVVVVLGAHADAAATKNTYHAPFGSYWYVVDDQ